jgi:hypothetical protein
MNLAKIITQHGTSTNMVKKRSRKTQGKQVFYFYLLLINIITSSVLQLRFQISYRTQSNPHLQHTPHGIRKL